MAIIAGHQRLESYDAEKFRNIYGAIIRYMGEKRDIKQIWPLATDSEGGVTPEYLEERNTKAMEIGKRLGIIKE
jgi:hypothetical protein